MNIISDEYFPRADKGRDGYRTCIKEWWDPKKYAIHEPFLLLLQKSVRFLKRRKREYMIEERKEDIIPGFLRKKKKKSMKPIDRAFRDTKKFFNHYNSIIQEHAKSIKKALDPIKYADGIVGENSQGLSSYELTQSLVLKGFMDCVRKSEDVETTIYVSKLIRELEKKSDKKPQ